VHPAFQTVLGDSVKINTGFEICGIPIIVVRICGVNILTPSDSVEIKYLDPTGIPMVAPTSIWQDKFLKELLARRDWPPSHSFVRKCNNAGHFIH